MAYVFGDGYDCYAATADAILGYWDSGATIGSISLSAGRFAGSQCVHFANATASNMIKSSAVNDAIHHISCAFRQTATISGTTLGLYFQLTDVAANQCCIVFRSDGTILLTSATPGGTVLATYAGAVTAVNTWFQFEFEVVINNTTGSFKVRKNGSTTDDHSTTGINTRPGANTYANKLTVGMQAAVNAQQIDDLLWRSDASGVPWCGDIRCYTRMPASDAAVQFARAPNPSLVSQTNAAGASTTSKAANLGCMSAFTASFDGTITTGTVAVSVGATGNMKVAIYDAARAVVLATSSAVVNPVSGNNTFTLTAPLTVTKGTVYYLATDQDATIVYNSTTGNFTFTTTYASFPAASPSTTGASAAPTFVVSLVPTNAGLVNETLQDGTTSYVYDSTVNDADFYTIAPIVVTPISVVAVTTRGFLQKSDAGTRGAAVQLKSGATTVTSTPTLLSSSFGWLWRTDLTDPNTTAAWTVAAVNNVTIGPKVTS